MRKYDFKFRIPLCASASEPFVGPGIHRDGLYFGEGVASTSNMNTQHVQIAVYIMRGVIQQSKDTTMAQENTRARNLSPM